MVRRHCLALDLKDNAELIQQYEYYHSKEGIWPEVLNSLKASGIESLEIYRTGNRLFMIMEVGPDFSFQKKNQLDQDNPKIQEWEALMWTFQQALPWALEGEKWIVMNKIFDMKG